MGSDNITERKQWCSSDRSVNDADPSLQRLQSQIKNTLTSNAEGEHSLTFCSGRQAISKSYRSRPTDCTGTILKLAVTENYTNTHTHTKTNVACANKPKLRKRDAKNSVKTKPGPLRTARTSVYHCARLWNTIQRRTAVLIIISSTQENCRCSEIRSYTDYMYYLPPSRADYIQMPMARHLSFLL